MKITNIYIISGFINERGYFENKNDYATYIAECEDENSEYVYYAFLYYDVKNKQEVNSSIIRIENLFDLFDMDVKPHSVPQEELSKYTGYIETIIENAKANETIEHLQKVK